MPAVTKIEPAIRQLNAAILLTFADGDPLAIRTLAGAALGILSDLVDVRQPGSSWRSELAKAAILTPRVTNEILNRAQNFLKHADRDPTDTLDLDEDENDDVLFVAILECGELGAQSSDLTQGFQIWYCAANPGRVVSIREWVRIAQLAVGNLDGLARRKKKGLHGATFMNRVRSHATTSVSA